MWCLHEEAQKAPSMCQVVHMSKAQPTALQESKTFWTEQPPVCLRHVCKQQEEQTQTSKSLQHHHILQQQLFCMLWKSTTRTTTTTCCCPHLSDWSQESFCHEQSSPAINNNGIITTLTCRWKSGTGNSSPSCANPKKKTKMHNTQVTATSNNSTITTMNNSQVEAAVDI